MDTHLAQGQRIESHIFVLRGHRVMLDADLAKLYGVAVKALNQAVKRNADRFPADFMFQLTWEEAESSRSQFVTLDKASSSRTTAISRAGSTFSNPNTTVSSRWCSTPSGR